MLNSPHLCRRCHLAVGDPSLCLVDDLKFRTKSGLRGEKKKEREDQKKKTKKRVGCDGGVRPRGADGGMKAA